MWYFIFLVTAVQGQGGRRLSVTRVSQTVSGGVQTGYLATTLEIGTPPRSFSVLLDTGSPLTVVPCKGCRDCGHDHQYDPHTSHSAKATGDRFDINYLEGSELSGLYWEDVVGITQQQVPMHWVGCATTMTREFKTQAADGICGLDESSRSLISSLRQHHKLPHNTFGFELCGDASLHIGVDTGTLGPIVWTPMSKGSNNYYVHASVTSHVTKWLIDSGTTYIYLQRQELAGWKEALSRFVHPSIQHSAVGCVGSTPDHDLPVLRFLREDNQLLMTLYPAQYLYAVGSGRCVGVFNTGWGNDNTIGLIALEEQESYFDLGLERFGIRNCRTS